ncbi:pentatricopeptide repeat-containing protein At3g49170, chloroplastic-like [Rutidosis leptorrhynchoides]|uniref:pentatricopeptide repeat-containing protein At3g49170, chloroplastic-like n=1 Tax=Rutidosis leptorrhynchoides TaxID=125765 RepID=UPI003A99BD0B
MAVKFRIHGFMKAIRRNGNTITHHNNLNRFLVPISSSSCFSNYHSKSSSSCEHPINDVIKEFDDMIQTRPLPPVEGFNMILHNLATQKTYSYSSSTLVLKMFEQMSAVGIPINTSTADSLIKCYCHLQQTIHSFTILRRCLKQGIECNNVSMYNTILDGFIGEDRTHEAERLFKKMFIFNNNNNNNTDELELVYPKPNIDSYNTMLKGLCKVGDNFTAIALLRIMDGRGGCCKPDIVSYNTVINGLCIDPGVVNTIDDALKLFNEMFLIKGIRPNADTYKSLIYAFCELGRWDEVCKMVKRMEDDENMSSLDTTGIFNIIVNALCKQNKSDEAWDVFIFMLENGYHPDTVTSNSVIKMFCSQGGMMSAASETFNLLEMTPGIKPDIVTYNRLIDGYMKDLNKDLAIITYSSIPEQLVDNVTRFLISGLLNPETNHHHYPSKPEYRYDIKRRYLHRLYTQPYYLFFEALNLFDFMDGHELNMNIEVYNILIFGANKSGRFDVARRLFHELTSVKGGGGGGLQPDDVTYTLLIRGFCDKRLFKDAKRMFVEMKRRGFLPDGVVDLNQLPLCYLERDEFFFDLDSDFRF